MELFGCAEEGVVVVVVDDVVVVGCAGCDTVLLLEFVVAPPEALRTL